MLNAKLKRINFTKIKHIGVTGLKQQLSKIDNSSLNTTHSARNLGFIFDEHLTFCDQISSLSKSCYSHIRQLRCIRPSLDSKTASTIAASIVHSKLDYCVWNVLQERVYYCTKVDNVVDLKQHIVAEWAALDHSIIPSANAQWHLRLHACIRAAGENFEHCLQ